MAFSPSHSHLANAVNNPSVYQSQGQLPPQPVHRASFSFQGSNGGDLRRDSNQDSWSGDDSGVEQDDNQDGSRKRKRPMSVSCELCKQRKVKCDRGQPTCGWCTRNGQICEYKERKKPGLRAGYGRELEARLDRLEAVITSQANAIAQLTSGTIQTVQAPSQQETNMFAVSGASMSSNVVERPELPSIQQIQQANSLYPPRTPSLVDFRSSYPGFSAGFNQTAQDTYQKSAPQQLHQDPQPYYTNEVASLATPNMEMSAAASHATSQDQDLPPYDLLYSLADLYFKHVNTWCPILHRRTTFDALFGPSSLDEADRILLHAIVATTLRFSTDPRLLDGCKEKYHLVSKQRVLLYGMENSSVKALQALVILALDLCGTSNGPPGWNVLALITRSAVQLGLSIEATSPAVSPRFPSIYTLRAMVLPESNSWIEDESRRRLFWMVYILDRYATLATAFEFALDEKEIDRKLPCRDDVFSRNQAVDTRWFRAEERADRGIDRPENLGSFSYYVEVIGILSKIHLFLKKPVDIGALSDVEQWQTEYRQLDSALTAWKNSLPREYSSTARLFDSSVSNKFVNCGWVMLHATYHTTVIRLHSSAAYPARRSPIFAPSFRASQICLTAVESISALCAHVKSSAMLSRLGPPFAFSVWVASRLLLVHSSTIDHQINPTIHFFVTTLRELGTWWDVADRYAALLQRVLDEFAESESAAANTLSTPGAERDTPRSVRILADMRRCAYDLDFLISRQPRMQMVAGGGGAASMGPTPNRTPAPNELEYLDVFDFFNMPRLPMALDAAAVAGGGVVAPGSVVPAFGFPSEGPGNGTGFGGDDGGGGGGANQSFGWDTNADWFMKGGE